MTVARPPQEVTERRREAPAARHRLVTRGHELWVVMSAQATVWQRRMPRLIAALRVIYLPLALALLGYVGYKAATKVDVSTIRLRFLALAFLSALVWWVALAAGWSTLVTEHIRLAPARAWCRTQVARYLPGGIWAPVARATTVQGRLRDKAGAVLAENLTVLAVAVGVGALWVTVHRPVWLPATLVIALPILGAGWLERRTKVTRTGVARTTGVYAVGYIAYGVSGVLCQVAVSGIRHPTYPLYVAGAACVAWAAGLVVVFAPGGVGVREVVYIWMLHGLYPRAELQAAAVTSRLVTVFAELTVLALVSVLPGRLRRPRTAAPLGLDTLSPQAGAAGDVGEG